MRQEYFYQETMATENKDLIDAVRHWVHFDNLAETLSKQIANAKSMRATFEEKVLSLLHSSGMKNSILQLNGAILQKQTKLKPSDLTWGFLEEHMTEYWNAKGKPEEAKLILAFLQTKRGGKMIDCLKKTVTSK